MKKTRRAFTLTEVLISLALLSFVMLGVIMAFSVDRYAASMSKHRLIAANIIRAELEAALAANYAGLANYSLPIAVYDGMNNFTMTKTFKVSDMDGYKIMYCKVTWTERAASLRTLWEEAMTYVAEE